MKWVHFALGLLIGAAGTFTAGRLAPGKDPAPNNDQIVFAGKAFVQSPTWVTISGTLTGEGLAYPNNTYSVACYRDVNGCIVTNIGQIGHNQIGRMDGPLLYPVVKWDEDEVIATTGPSDTMCSNVTITIERKQGTLLWVEEPINQSLAICKYSNPKIAKYTIEDSPGWKRVFGKK